jgi:hypothetical protein
VTEDGAVEHIDALTRRHTDREVSPRHREEEGPRVVIRISTDRVATS